MKKLRAKRLLYVYKKRGKEKGKIAYGEEGASGP
jgi:hypothetical protein